jgi:hypothetical protein
MASAGLLDTNIATSWVVSSIGSVARGQQLLEGQGLPPALKDSFEGGATGSVRSAYSVMVLISWTVSSLILNQQV